MPIASLPTVLCALAVAAQVPETGATPPSGAVVPDENGVVVARTYDERRSWALFAACDTNADDRLDLFEASRGITEFSGPRDPATFRRIDRNSDGFLQWPEFDTRYRETVEHSGSFRVRPSRPVVDPVDPTDIETARGTAGELLQNLDRDGDSQIGLAEFRVFLELARLDPGLASQFDALDVDRSGRLTVAEFQPALQFAAGVDDLLKPNRELRRKLPLEFQAADRDLDGVISREEFELALRRLHPSLARWTDRCLADADLNGNRSLGAAEILRALRIDRDLGDLEALEPVRGIR